MERLLFIMTLVVHLNYFLSHLWWPRDHLWRTSSLHLARWNRPKRLSIVSCRGSAGVEGMTPALFHRQAGDSGGRGRRS
ncbi:hypothetical protein NL676_038171 [Syzygium grande]|nr:hypothetical protein NL676_038171 [Syzygium grande]